MSNTDKKIHEIADELVENNIKPTLANVRKELGGGSFTTISDAMKIWRSNQVKEEALADIKEPAPDQITEQLNDLGSNLWEFAQSLATDRLKSEREALEVARGEYEAIASEAGELADALSLELEEEAKKLEETIDKHDALVTINSELLTKTADQDKEVKNLSLSVTNLEVKAKGFEDSNKELSKENAKLSGHIEELGKEKQDNLSKINELNNQIGGLDSDLKNAHKNNVSEIANLNNTHKEKEQIIKKQMEDALKAKNRADTALSDRVNKELSDSEERNKNYVSLVEKQEKLRDELDKVRTDRDVFKNEIILLKTKNDEKK